MFEKLLIANRGEIARRIIRTARAMGVRTVAVYSDADARSLAVREADEAVHIGGASPSESYLVTERILEAARRTGAQAIHPGYGFLSENAGFVEAVEAAGLVFVGPPSAAVRAMGRKDTAKQRMAAIGVPVVPGYDGQDPSPERMADEAARIGYPVLIKARSGGGGRGMRRVDDPRDFPAALEAARREAQAAFGDGHCLIEKYITTPRHIEIQILADTHGRTVPLFERDCSLQRRHQKVIEEAPAPGMTPELRSAMGEAAVRAAREIGYTGAGTVEFIVDASGPLRADGFWFLEMNTRLQVEHPVTEAITGLDLVELQLRIAAGEPLPLGDPLPPPSGWAVEARLYAEKPEAGFLPATGTLERLAFPTDLVRVDSAVTAGDTVSPHYDPMIAKLVAHGPDRRTALARLHTALARTELSGVDTNREFLLRLLEDTAVQAGFPDTGLIERSLDTLTARPAPSDAVQALAALVLAGVFRTPSGPDPWDTLRGFRTFGPIETTLSFGIAGTSCTVTLCGRDALWTATIGERTLRIVLPDTTDATVAEIDGLRLSFTTAPVSDGFTLETGGGIHRIECAALDADPDDHTETDSVRSPMPGCVNLIHVSVGDRVRKGDPLLVVEAMKMEHAVSAPAGGTIVEILARPGDQVENNALLVRLDHTAPHPTP
ncbi:ATP-grasp domain-containing protein [Phaeovibrio sulfidiphilus]|uniref:ATP-grasp domain-containing protein n=1 Tax=Phaeovibrio sulfidiphilus TaxID=1220600 RepID=A0A8J6YZ10_9PROT|nr:biotin carboxylase N-terminal domain-containing protein [Phaeovibrio sulfidiphilus]MBE1237148.1 ATP-grasp domain-containing protein [Phaeovibrio sulfidiphilus]